MVAGLGAVVVVRAMLWSNKHSVRWNICVLILAMMATFVTLEGHASSTGSMSISFWVGIFYGGLGQGIINIGKSAMMAGLRDRLGKALEAFMGTGGGTEGK